MSRERSSRSRERDRDRDRDSYRERDRDRDRGRDSFDSRDRRDRDYDRRDRDYDRRDSSSRDRGDRDRSRHDDRISSSHVYDEQPSTVAPISGFDPTVSHQQQVRGVYKSRTQCVFNGAHTPTCDVTALLPPRSLPSKC